MKSDLIIGLIGALILHAGLVLGGEWLKGKPTLVRVDDTIPIVELTPLPPVEPEVPEIPEPSAEAGGDISDIVPPMQADTPAPTASTLVQQIQPPPPPSINRSSNTITIPGRPGNGIGTGNGLGFKNLFDLASLDQIPVARTSLNLIYPQEMRRAGVDGQVVVDFIVDSEGEVRNAYVVRSTHRGFEAEALRAVSRWKFKPGRKSGSNVSTRMSQQIVFKIPEN